MARKLGKFITFEGIDGVGKSTQIKFLADYLSSNGKEIVMTREPGGCHTAELIRDIILKSDYEPIAELLLFTTARIEHYFKVIKPALEQGKTVLCDRFIDSTIVYQGINGIKEDVILDLHNTYIENKFPDITFLLVANPELCLERINLRQDLANRFDEKGSDHLGKIQNQFKKLAQRNKNRYIVIDANQDENDVFKQIVEELDLLEVL